MSILRKTCISCVATGEYRNMHKGGFIVQKSKHVSKIVVLTAYNVELHMLTAMENASLKAISPRWIYGISQ